MAKGTKPGGTKPEAEEQDEGAEVAPKKSSKKLIIILIVSLVSLAAIAGGLWMLLKPSAPPEGMGMAPAGQKAEEKIEVSTEPPKFVDLGSFTTNLSPEEGDRFVQVAITLKVSRKELEVSIADRKPEIMHRVNMLLQTKLPSELSTHAGKTQLAEQLKAQIQHVLGLRKTVPAIGAEQTEVAPESKIKGGLDEVLFTSFLIQ